VFEPWPDEPDEPSAETRWGNPERDLPRIPEVSTDESDVDPHTFKTFWVSVVFANAALFGVSLGLMLWYFRGQALLGGSLVAVGLLAGARTYAAYRTFRDEDRESETVGDENAATTAEAVTGSDDATADPIDAVTDSDDGLSEDDEAEPTDVGATATPERNG
jgi:hypothetical protein